MDTTSIYSHRNGETEPPIEWGYFFYEGQIVKPGQVRGRRRHLFVLVFGPSNDNLRIRVDNKIIPVGNCTGRWWGPVTPPWELANGA